MNLKNFDDIPLTMQGIIIGVFCIIFFSLGYMWDISTIKKKLVTEKTHEQDLKLELEALAHTNDKLQTDVAKTPNISAALKEWQGKLVKVSGLPDLLNDILKVGTANQLQFNLFTPGAEVKEGSYLKVPIKTVVTGDYKQIATFISQIANMPSIIVIGDFLIAKQDSTTPKDNTATNDKASVDTSNDMLRAELTLEVYYLPEK
ncbi:MAG: type 4a pilus biogenesis protein PilO [Gammaproteobacteria bacterium]|nr:type 4a pilus biogenesis protein PilO [Gammaproteobacteria bacterium]